MDGSVCLNMRLIIDGNKKISVLKMEFNALFPYLKVEFFFIRDTKGEGTSKKAIVPDNKTLDECGTTHKGGEINILPDSTVAELEQNFIQNYNLGIQVFRQSGKAWLETSLTDSWTLEHQNRHGEMLSKI
jgi:glycerol-3-phosphate O-acyltransferase